MSRSAASARTLGYSGPEAARLAGVSYRQLDLWCSSGLVTPSIQNSAGPGFPRRFSDEDVACLRAVGVLRSLASPELARDVVAHVRAGAEGPCGPRGVWIEPLVIAGVADAEAGEAAA